MFCRFSIVIAGVSVLSACSAADQPAPPVAKPKQEDVKKALEGLGHDKFSARASALKELERVGPELLPLLKEAFRAAKDPEVRRRLEEMLPGLEHSAALSPTHITLNLKDKPVKEAIKELAKLSGYKLDLVPQGDARENKAVSIDLQEVPFWQALDRVCDQCGLYFQEGWYGNDQMAVRLEYGEISPGFTYFSGPFRLSAKGFDYNRHVEFANAPRRGLAPQVQPVNRNENLSMRLNVTVEPKLPMLNTGMPLITEATDEFGASMAPQQQGQTHYSYYGGYRMFTQQVQAQLTPTKGATKIKVLKGTVPVTAIAAQREKLVVEKIMDVKNQTYKAGTTTLTIESVFSNGGEIEIKMSFTEAGNRNDPGRVNNIAQRLSLLDDKGNKYYGYARRWTGTNNGGNGTLCYNSNGQNVTEPVRLVLYDWTTITHNVPFEFKDLPLP
jgi:hypothetical protein